MKIIDAILDPLPDSVFALFIIIPSLAGFALFGALAYVVLSVVKGA